MASNDDEFRRSVRDVQPLRLERRADLRRPAPAPVAHQRRRDELEALAQSLAGPVSVEDALDSGENPSYLRAGMSRETLRKLRRGHWAIQDGVDLHGLNRDEAAALVVEFLDQCLARGVRCVRIVHGKGLGILKARLRKWLPQRDDVLAFCQAPASEGGGGALRVLLNTRKKR